MYWADLHLHFEKQGVIIILVIIAMFPLAVLELKPKTPIKYLYAMRLIHFILFAFTWIFMYGMLEIQKIYSVYPPSKFEKACDCKGLAEYRKPFEQPEKCNCYYIHVDSLKK